MELHFSASSVTHLRLPVLVPFGIIFIIVVVALKFLFLVLSESRPMLGLKSIRDLDACPFAFGQLLLLMPNLYRLSFVIQLYLFDLAKLLNQ